ncbi:MAG: hypothetical protein M3Q31_07890 [Actinomycetota bacterium]|nr:hypothetical protein [Actinomycetota bacterium]
MDDLVNPAQSRLTRRRVANISADHLHAGGLEVGGNRFLSVQQAIEHPHGASSQYELLAGEGANVAGSAGDQCGAFHRTSNDKGPVAVGASGP